MMFQALSGLNGVLTDTCYYSCAVVNPNSLPACAVQCCSQFPDSSDALCSGANLPQSPAETSAGVVADVVDAATGSFPGGSNAAAAATCATNPTFTCWWQQNGTTAIMAVGGIVAIFAVAELLKAAK